MSDPLAHWPLGPKNPPVSYEDAIDRVAGWEREMDRLDRERPGMRGSQAADEEMAYRGRLLENWRRAQFDLRLNGRVTAKPLSWAEAGERYSALVAKSRAALAAGNLDE